MKTFKSRKAVAEYLGMTSNRMAFLKEYYGMSTPEMTGSTSRPTYYVTEEYEQYLCEFLNSITYKKKGRKKGNGNEQMEAGNKCASDYVKALEKRAHDNMKDFEKRF